MTPQPLPLALEPDPNETWHSYLVRRAAQHGCTVAALATNLGIRDTAGRWPAYYGIRVDDAWASPAAARLSLTVEQIRAMHLEAFDQRAVDLTDLDGAPGIATTRLVAHRLWIRLAGSAYCPQCVADGMWRVTWRLPWATVCPRHHTFLLALCPRCRGIPGTANTLHGSAPSRAEATPDGRLCERPARSSPGKVCAFDLSTAAAPAADLPAVRRAELITEIITSGHGTVAGRPTPALEALRGWQHAICLARHFGRAPEARWGSTHRWATPPADPREMDQLLAAAEPLVCAPDAATAADHFERWCWQAGHRTVNADTFARASKGSAALEPVIGALLRRRGRAHVLAQRRLDLDQVADLERWHADDVPQLVWACALPKTLQRSTKPDQLILRAVVAMILARIQTGATDWVTAGAFLGLPAHGSRQWTRYAFSSRHGDLKDALIAAAHRLVPLLSRQPNGGMHAARPAVSGVGLAALAHAQAPECARADPSATWCPCSSDQARN